MSVLQMIISRNNQNPRIIAPIEQIYIEMKQTEIDLFALRAVFLLLGLSTEVIGCDCVKLDCSVKLQVAWSVF